MNLGSGGVFLLNKKTKAFQLHCYFYAGVAFSSAVRGGVQYTTLHHGLWPFSTADPPFTKLIFHPMHFIKEVPH